MLKRRTAARPALRSLAGVLSGHRDYPEGYPLLGVKRTFWISLFDGPVSECKNACRDFEPDRLCRLKINHQLKLCWLLNRQISRLGDFQYLVDKDGRCSKDCSDIRPVRD